MVSLFGCLVQEKELDRQMAKEACMKTCLLQQYTREYGALTDDQKRPPADMASCSRYTQSLDEALGVDDDIRRVADAVISGIIAQMPEEASTALSVITLPLILVSDQRFT